MNIEFLVMQQRFNISDFQLKLNVRMPYIAQKEAPNTVNIVKRIEISKCCLSKTNKNLASNKTQTLRVKR